MFIACLFAVHIVPTYYLLMITEIPKVSCHFYNIFL